MTGLRVLTLLVGLGVLLAAVEVLRRRRLREKYVVLWLLVGVGAGVLGVFPGLLDVVADALGIADPPNLLAFGGIVFLLGVCAHLTYEVSRVEAAARDLAEEAAILREQVERLEDRADRPAGPAAPVERPSSTA